MNYQRKLSRKLNNFFSDNILTISGEINITVSSIEGLNSFDESLRGINESIKNIGNEYDFLKVEVRRGLADISIKFFAYQERISDKNFLDSFTDVLSEFLVSNWNNQIYKIQVNIFGTYIIGANKKVEFRFLNKKNDVKYIIVNEYDNSYVEYLKNSKWINVGLSLMVICCIVYYIYLTYYEKIKMITT